MTAPELEALAALDWNDYDCQCSARGCHCHNRATHVVEIHKLHACNDSGLNDYGNRVELRCYQCVVGLLALVADRLRLVGRAPGPVECDTCRAPLRNIRDVVRDIVPLEGLR